MNICENGFSKTYKAICWCLCHPLFYTPSDTDIGILLYSIGLGCLMISSLAGFEPLGDLILPPIVSQLMIDEVHVLNEGAPDPCRSGFSSRPPLSRDAALGLLWLDIGSRPQIAKPGLGSFQCEPTP